MKAYTVLLTALIVVLSFLLITRTDVESMILHTPGTLPQIDDVEQTVKNLYNYKIINKTKDVLTVEFVPQDDFVNMSIIGDKKSITVEPQKVAEGALFITIENKNIKQLKTKLDIDVVSEGELIEEIETMFLGPVTQ
jgi:hypothetical protein